MHLVAEAHLPFTALQLLAFAVNQAVYMGGLEQGWRIVFAAMAWCPLVMLLLLVIVLPGGLAGVFQLCESDTTPCSAALHTLCILRCRLLALCRNVRVSLHLVLLS